MAQLVTAECRLGRSVQTTSVPPVGLSSVLPASSLPPACVSRSLRPLLWSSPALQGVVTFSSQCQGCLGGLIYFHRPGRPTCMWTPGCCPSPTSLECVSPSISQPLDGSPWRSIAPHTAHNSTPKPFSSPSVLLLRPMSPFWLLVA